ncbi:MAG: dihydropteroate synthase [Armatimonadetes bacterium]|nr:dihydropteroate synthase [Armatimonadota bacterium]
MIVIGERINGMFKDVREAIQARDPGPIKELALKQVQAGAHYLDVNVGPAAEDPREAMRWLVETIREVTDAPLCIDTTKPDIMRLGIEAAGGTGKAMINSTTGEKAKLDVLLPLAAEFNVPIIALTIDENGVPRDANGRTQVALNVLAAAMEYGIPPENLFIDAVILPVSAQQENPGHVLETIRQIKILSDPPPKTVIGLSNVSQNTIYRPLINRTYLVMALAAGLDAAILDCLDEELMDAMITAELLLNRQVYCDDYLKAYRKRSA